MQTVYDIRKCLWLAILCEGSYPPWPASNWKHNLKTDLGSGLLVKMRNKLQKPSSVGTPAMFPAAIVPMVQMEEPRLRGRPPCSWLKHHGALLRALSVCKHMFFPQYQMPMVGRENVSQCCPSVLGIAGHFMNEWMLHDQLLLSVFWSLSLQSQEQFYHWEFWSRGKWYGRRSGCGEEMSGRTLCAKTLLTERNVLLLPYPAPTDRLLDSFRRCRNCAAVR